MNVVSLQDFDINKITLGPVDIRIGNDGAQIRNIKIQYDAHDFIILTHFMLSPFGINSNKDLIEKEKGIEIDPSEYKYNVYMNMIDKYENKIMKKAQFENKIDKHRISGANENELKFIELLDKLTILLINYIVDNKNGHELLIKYKNMEETQINNSIIPIYNQKTQEYSPMIKLKLYSKVRRNKNRINECFYDLEGNQILSENLMNKEFKMASCINVDNVFMSNEYIKFQLYLHQGFIEELNHRT